MDALFLITLVLGIILLACHAYILGAICLAIALRCVYVELND